jgi:hypothetical protein
MLSLSEKHYYVNGAIRKISLIKDREISQLNDKSRFARNGAICFRSTSGLPKSCVMREKIRALFSGEIELSQRFGSSDKICRAFKRRSPAHLRRTFHAPKDEAGAGSTGFREPKRRLESEKLESSQTIGLW